jgi:hypothetical protein
MGVARIMAWAAAAAVILALSQETGLRYHEWREFTF